MTDALSEHNEVPQTNGGNTSTESQTNVEAQNTQASTTTSEVTPDYGLTGEESSSEQQDVDWKERYGHSSNEFQRFKKEEFEPIKTVYDQLNSLYQTDPEYAALVDKKLKKMQAKPGADQDIDRLVEEKISARLKPLEKTLKQEQEKELETRNMTLYSLEKQHPDLLIGKDDKQVKVLRQEIGKKVNALFMTGLYKSYNQAAAEVFTSYDPKSLIRKGENNVYLSQVDKENASISQQTSETGKSSDDAEVNYNDQELAFAKKLDPRVYKSMHDKMHGRK